MLTVSWFKIVLVRCRKMRKGAPKNWTKYEHEAKGSSNKYDCLSYQIVKGKNYKHEGKIH